MLQNSALQYRVFNLVATCLVLLSQSSWPVGAISTGNYAFIKAHDDGDAASGYLYLGGLFGVHEAGESADSCGGVRPRGVQNLEAFLWAVRTYQSRYPDSLKGLRIGALGFDSCTDSFHLQQQVANFRQRLVEYGRPAVDPDSVLAFVGPDQSTEAVDLAAYLSSRGPPIVSHAATSSLLSDKRQYPYFVRTVPSDAVQVDAIIRILMELRWNYVQLVHSDNTFGSTGRDSFVSAAASAGICIVNTQAVADAVTEKQLDAVMASLLDNRATRAVVVFADEVHTHALLTAAARDGARGFFTWFGTTEWATSAEVVSGVEEEAEGAVTLSLASSVSYDDNLLQFGRYFGQLEPQTNLDDPWFKQYWSDRFRCYFADVPNPNGYNRLCDDITETLADADLDVFVPYTIRAVDAALNGIDRARRDACRLSSDGLCPELLDGDWWKKIFRGVIDEPDLFNRTTGDPINAAYNIYNYRMDQLGPCNGHCYTPIGEYTASPPQLNMDEVRVHTYNMVGMRTYEATSVCGQSPCAVCGETAAPPTVTTDAVTGLASENDVTAPAKLRSEKWVIPLLTLACIGIALVVVFDIYLLCKIFGTPYMKHWRTMWLGQLLLVGILLCYLTVLAFIVTPTRATCGIIRFGVGVSYAMCFSVLLVKLMILISSESVGYLKGAFQVLMFLFAWGIQIVIDTEWLLLRNPDAVSSADDPDVMVCRYGDFTSHVESLIYIMFLILLCTAMAIRTSRISTNHREGVFIGLSTGFAIPIWLVWILVGVLYDGPGAEDPCLAFGMLLTATVLLFVMFLPKVRQLNSMGVEGIYAEDDSPEFTASVVQAAPNSVPAPVVGYASTKPPSVIGYASSKTGEGSVILLPNGEMYAEPVRVRPVVKPDPTALYLRHPGSQPTTLRGAHSIESASVRSVPLGHQYQPKRYEPSQAQSDTIRSTTRVLKVTNDLTGRKTPVLNRKDNADTNYGGSRPSSRNSDSKSELSRLHKIADLGSL